MGPSMSGYSPVFCGKCCGPVKLTIDASWLATVGCPSCGETDTFDNATKEAGEYLTDLRQRATFMQMGEALPDPQPRSFRFIRDYQPG